MQGMRWAWRRAIRCAGNDVRNATALCLLRMHPVPLPPNCGRTCGLGRTLSAELLFFLPAEAARRSQARCQKPQAQEHVGEAGYLLDLDQPEVSATTGLAFVGAQGAHRSELADSRCRLRRGSATREHVQLGFSSTYGSGTIHRKRYRLFEGSEDS